MAIIAGICSLVFLYAGMHMWQIHKKSAILLYFLFALSCCATIYNAGM